MDRTIIIWESIEGNWTGKVVANFTDSPICASWSKFGKKFAALSIDGICNINFKIVKIGEFNTKWTTSKFLISDASSLKLEWHPNLNILAILTLSSIILIKVEEIMELTPINTLNLEKPLFNLCFSPSGTILLGVGNEESIIVNTSNGELMCKLSGCYCGIFKSDEEIIMCGYDVTLVNYKESENKWYIIYFIKG